MSEAVAVSPYKDIIVAAVNAAGPIPMAEDGKTPDKYKWNQNVSAAAVDIAVLTSSNSPVAKKLAMLETCKKFVGTIQGVRKEASSTRGLVVMKTKPSTRTPDGIEMARTERTDSNPETAAFANHLRTLVGHRVLFWIELQEMADGGGKVRVVQHVEDLGLDEQFDAEEAKAATDARLSR